MQPFKISIFFLVTILFLAACTVTQHYQRPPAPVPEQYKELKNWHNQKNLYHWQIARPNETAAKGSWWHIFKNATLNDLEKNLKISNQTILNAKANYLQALALVDEARADYYPNLSLTGAIERQKTAINVGETNTTPGSRLSTPHSIGVSASWIPDLWQGIKLNVEANVATAKAQYALLESVQLSAEAALAQYYFQICGLDLAQRLLDKAVKDYKKIATLTRNQYAAGIVSRADLLQANSLVETTEAAAINNQLLRHQYEHAIAVLIGLPPAAYSLPVQNVSLAVPSIPIAMPSALLERRPDVAQAERLMQAANAEIGIAQVAFYPQLTIGASATAIGNGIGHWFALPALGWALGPQLSQFLIDGGLRSATLRAAKAAYFASIANYRQKVLGAFQNVEDNLAAVSILNMQIKTQEKATHDADQALRIVSNQYAAGVVAYNIVLTAEVNALTTKQTLVDIKTQKIVAAVNLIAALGGSW